MSTVKPNAPRKVTVKNLHDDLKDYYFFFEKLPVQKLATGRGFIKFSSFLILTVFFWLYLLVSLSRDTGGWWAMFFFLLFSIFAFIYLAKIAIDPGNVMAMSSGPDGEHSAQSLFESHAKTKQQWFCERYQCEPVELLEKLRELEAVWQERQKFLGKGTENLMDQSIKNFFKLFALRNLFALLAVVLPVFVSIASGMKLFEGEDWASFGNILKLFAGFSVVAIVFYLSLSVIFSITIMLFIYILEQCGILPPYREVRVNKYFLAMHLSSDEIEEQGAGMARFLQVIDFFHRPVNSFAWYMHIFGRSRNP